LGRLILINFIYLITDRNISGLTHTRIARQAIAAGVGTVQLREKNLSKKEIYQEALSIRAVSLKYKTKFIVNDYIDIALAVDADGVHLGQEDMPVEYARKIMGRQKIIGVSTHSKKQAVRAQETRERTTLDSVLYLILQQKTPDVLKGSRPLRKLKGILKFR
jgi:thiamine-phosphate pyrophosphorylase